MIIYEKKYPKKAHLMALMLLMLVITLAILCVVIIRSDHIPVYQKTWLLIAVAMGLLSSKNSGSISNHAYKTITI